MARRIGGPRVLARGVAVAVGAALAYLIVVWPSLNQIEGANTVIRLVMLVGTAVGVGILAQVEEIERMTVAKLTADAQAREQFIGSVVESLNEGLVVLDLEGRVVAWNRAMQERYGITAEEVRGQHCLDRFPNYGAEGLTEPLQRLLSGEIEHFSLESLVHQTLLRGVVVQNLKGSLLRQNGRPTGAVLLIQDITERMALERSARQAEKLAALGTLAAGLAHELNNPIGIISSRVSATNRDLREAAAKGQFREELYYRVNVIAIKLPPLRERAGDVALLARAFLKRYGRGRITGIDDGAMQALEAYASPGNVRELQNVIERACALVDGEIVNLIRNGVLLTRCHEAPFAQALEVTRQLRDLDVLVASIAERQAAAALTLVSPTDDQACLVGIGQKITVGLRDLDGGRRCGNRFLRSF